jgi:hypothetical protein
MRGLDQLGQVGDPDHRVGRGLEPEQAGPRQRGEHRFGVGDIDPADRHSTELLLVGEQHRHPGVAAGWHDRDRAGRPSLDDRSDRGHAR